MQLYSSLITMIPTFLPHHYIKHCQSKFYNEQKEQVAYDSSMAMLQILVCTLAEETSYSFYKCLLEWVRTSVKCNYI